MFLSWVDDLGHPFLSSIDDILRSIFYFVCKWLYDLLISIYDSFKIISKVRILDISVVEQIAGRIGLLTAIIMFFLVAFSFVQYILDPDKVNDKEIGGGTLVKKILVVIVLLGTSTYIFKTLDKLQDTILDGGIVEKILLPSKIKVTDDFGRKFSVELFSAFYRYNEYTNDSDCQAELSETENNFLKGYVIENGIFPDSPSQYDGNNNCLTKEVENQKVTSFNGLIAIIVAIVAGYFLLMYTISVGIRSVQLAFLQVISPAAIIGYLEPKKDNMFTKWLKIYISTYIDVFVRIAIINLCIFMISIVIDGIYGVSNTNQTLVGAFAGSVGQGNLYIMIIMVMAILSFAKKAPELLKELLPAGGASKIGFGANFGTLFGAGAGLVGGAIGGQGLGRLSGAAVGLLHGGRKGMGSKSLLESMSGGYGSAKEAALKTEARVAAGGSRFVLPGAQSRAARYNKEKEKLESQNNFANSISSHVDAIKERALGQIDKGKFTDSEHIAKRNAAMQSIEALKERAKNMDIRSFDSWTASELASRGISIDSDNYAQEFTRLRQEEYNRQQENISEEINKYQEIRNNEETEAINDFVKRRQDDAVVAQHISQINAEIANGPSDVNLVGSTSDWTGLDNMSNSAKQVVSDNLVELSKNKNKGERARADAGK